MRYKIEWNDGPGYSHGWSQALEGGLEHEVTRLFIKGATEITITEEN